MAGNFLAVQLPARAQSRQVEWQCRRSESTDTLLRLYTVCSNRKARWRTKQSRDRAELQQIKEIQAKDPVARDQATGEHPVAKIYKALQTGEPLPTEELQLGGTELRSGSRLSASEQIVSSRSGW